MNTVKGQDGPKEGWRRDEDSLHSPRTRPCSTTRDPTCLMAAPLTARRDRTLWLAGVAVIG
jgi:hypothetical protein